MVTVFSKNNCIQCKMTKRFLEEHNIAFIEHNNLKAEGFLATPVVKLPDGNAFTGFRPDRLLAFA